MNFLKQIVLRVPPPAVGVSRENSLLEGVHTYIWQHESIESYLETLKFSHKGIYKRNFLWDFTSF